MPYTPSDTKHLTVSALTKYLQKKFDVDPYLNKVVLIGEISNFNQKATKHRYFSLKDESAKISAVMFQSAYNKLNFQPQEGMKVIVTGRVAIYGPSGSYQITIDSMQPDGVGALYQAYEQLKNKLQAEGAFDQLKKVIPKYPRKIAVITSPSGAVIRDIMTTIRRRYPIVQVVVYPVKVQGIESAQEIVSALDAIEQQAQDYDTIIIARGGGSIEDLWSFNEEIVARAILNCSLPVISSIGHETDFTIADYVSDLRAPTPTAAAELSVPVLSEVIQQIQQLEHRLYQSMQQKILLYKKHLDRYQSSYVLQEPDRIYQVYAQRLDEMNRMMYLLFRRYVDHQQLRLSQYQDRLQLQNPVHRIQESKQLVLQQQDALIYRMQIYINQCRQDFNSKMNVLDALSPLKILKRGYAVVETDQGIIQSIEDVQINDKIKISVSDGTILAIASEVNKEDMNGFENKK